jgi:hypothetical protein
VVKVNSKLKLGAATIGASAVLAMGVFAVASTGLSSAQDETEVPPPGPVTTTPVTTGETVTETVAPEAPETTAAVPPITTTPTPIPTGEA